MAEQSDWNRERVAQILVGIALRIVTEERRSSAHCTERSRDAADTERSVPLDP